MPRKVRDSNLETRTARAKLRARGKPYYRALAPGLHLGYRKGKTGGRWLVRWYIGDGDYAFGSLDAVADDHLPADGAAVLDFGQAQEAARRLYSAANKPAALAAAAPITLATAAARYVRYLRAVKSAKQGKDTLRRLRRNLPHSLRRRAIRDITKTEIEAWFWSLVRRDPADPEVERKSQDTANRVLTMVKAALNRAFADEKNDVPTDKPWRTVKPFEDVGRSRKLALNADQRQRLINASHGAFRNLVIATLYTGSRPAPGEIAQCRVRDFDPDLGVIHIAHSKTGPRDVPLSSEAVRWFRSIAIGRGADDLLLPKDDSKPWGISHQLRPMRKAAEAAKLPKGASMYTLRHTFASEHIMRGTDLKSLADVMGTSVAMLERHYSHILTSHKRKIVEAAGFRLGIKVKSNVRPLRLKKERAA